MICLHRSNTTGSGPKKTHCCMPLLRLDPPCKPCHSVDSPNSFSPRPKGGILPFVRSTSPADSRLFHPRPNLGLGRYCTYRRVCIAFARARLVIGQGKNNFCAERAGRDGIKKTFKSAGPHCTHYHGRTIRTPSHIAAKSLFSFVRSRLL